MIQYKPNKINRVIGLNEAIDSSEKDFSYEMVPLLRKDFQLTPEGELLIQNNKFMISEGGIRNLCSMLRIPDPFAERIPTDLFIANVNRLLKEKPDNRVNAYFSVPENILVDTNEKVNFQPIPIKRLLSQLDQNNIIRVFFENHFAKIETIPSTGLQVEVKGDIHSIGNTIFHYPTCKSVPQGYINIMTLACTNGAIAPRSFLREKLNIKSLSDADNLIMKFIEKICKIALGKDKLEQEFKRLHDTTFTSGEVNKLFHTTKRAVGIDDVENVLGKGLVGAYQELKQIEDSELDTDANKYATYYQVSNYASNLTKSARLSRKFQSLAGRILLDKL